MPKKKGSAKNVQILREFKCELYFLLFRIECQRKKNPEKIDVIWILLKSGWQMDERQMTDKWKRK